MLLGFAQGRSAAAPEVGLRRFFALLVLAKQRWALLLAASMVSLLMACGGGGGGSDPVSQPTLSIHTQPADVTTTPGAVATFRVGVVGAAGVQWQRLADGGQWLDVPGATGMELVLAGLTQADDGHQYRAQILDGSGRVVLMSSAVTVHVTPATVAPAVAGQPTDLHVVVGQVPRFTVTATGTTLRYQWQVSTDGMTWIDVAGASSETLELPAATLTDSGRLYRVQIQNASGTATSRAVTLGVQPAPQRPRFTAQPQAVSVEAGQTAIFTATASGEPAPSLQWESSQDGQTWSPVAGASSSTLVLSATDLRDNGRQFRAVATNTQGSTSSEAAPLTVAPAAVAPSFSLMPKAVTVNQAQAVQFDAEATGMPTPTYQWQVSTDGGSTFHNVNGAVSGSLRLATTTAEDEGKRYRVIASNRVGDVVSPAVRLTVQQAPQITTHPASVTSGVSDAAVTMSVGGTGLPAPEVQWQVSSDEGASYRDIPGATSASYTWSPTRNDGGQLVRARLSNVVGAAYSQPARLRKARWTHVSPSFAGSRLNAVIWVDASVVIAVGDQGVIVRSTDAGLSWQFVREAALDQPGLHRMARLDNTTVLATGESGELLRSEDAGLTWRSVPLPFKGFASGFSFRNANVGMLSSYNDGLYRTLDGGRTWTQVPTSDNGQPFFRLGTVALRGSLGFLTGDNGWYRSVDGGASWHLVDSQVWTTSTLDEVSFLEDQTLVVATPIAGLHRSVDGGQTWQTMNGGNTSLGWRVRFTDDGRVGIDLDASARSVDGGQTWNRRTQQVGQFTDIRFGPTDVGVSVADNGELRRSTDLGETWTEPYGSQGLDGSSVWGVEFPANDAHGFAFVKAGDMKIYETFDGGYHWQPKLSVPDLQSNGVSDGVTHFIDAEVGLATAMNAPLLRTIDGGRTWQTLPTVGLLRNNTSLSMVDRLTVVASNDAGIVRSTDGGTVWTTTYAADRYDQNTPQVVSARGNVVLAAMRWEGTLRSTDGGVTWTLLHNRPFQGFPKAMTWVSDTRVYLVHAYGNLLRSDDAGLTWTEVNLGEATGWPFSSIKFSADGQMGVVVSTNVIYRTSDGGRTWNRDLVRDTSWWQGAAFAGNRSPVVVGMHGAVAVGSGY